MRIRALTCNLRGGRASANALTDLIVGESVDVLCAQELSHDLAESISAQLPYGDMSHDQIQKGNGIATRYPVKMDRIRMPKRDGWVAGLSPDHWPSLPFAVEIANVHISGPHTWPYFPHPVRRKAQVTALLEHHERKADVPHAVFGDFNASPSWPVYKRMVSRYVDGALESCDQNSGNGDTWPYMPLLGIRGLLRIDHCFLWKLSAEKLQTVEIPGSDHLGLLVDIEVSSSQRSQ